MEGLRNLNRQHAFDLIKRYASETHRRALKHKGISMEKIKRCFSNNLEFKLRINFNKMRQWHDRCVTRDNKIRIALRNM